MSADGNSIRIQKVPEVTHCASGLRLDDICNFGGCPWVKLDPAWMYSGSDASAQHGDEFIMSEGLNAVHDNANLNPLSRAAEAALETRPIECRDMYLLIQGAQFVHVANQPFNIVAVEKALLRLRCKPTLVF